MSTKNLHTVEPAEDLHNIGLDTEHAADPKWAMKNVKPVMATESDRKTGQISAEKSAAFKDAGTTPTM
jgi:hypothetical protein